MKLNAEGKKLYDIWEQNYHKENNELGGNSAKGDFVEGWSIIDNTHYVKTLTDECGLLIFGYDNDAPWIVEDWIDAYGAEDVIFTDCNGNKYTCMDVKIELLKYFEPKYKEDDSIYANDNFVDDEEKMRDFYELTKDEFLASYSYLTEAEYDNTAKLVNK
jgi:hypothetical protein